MKLQRISRTSFVRKTHESDQLQICSMYVSEPNILYSDKVKLGFKL